MMPVFQFGDGASGDLLQRQRPLLDDGHPDAISIAPARFRTRPRTWFGDLVTMRWFDEVDEGVREYRGQDRQSLVSRNHELRFR
jgi:hypothetical protein